MSTQSFDNLNLLLQMLQATRNLAANMIGNANTHIAMANAQTPDLATLTKYVNDSAASYLSIINRARSWVTNNNAQATAAVGLIGATLADLNNYVTPLITAATNLQNADKSSYANIVTACNTVLAAVSAPANVFP